MTNSFATKKYNKCKMNNKSNFYENWNEILFRSKLKDWCITIFLTLTFNTSQIILSASLGTF